MKLFLSFALLFSITSFAAVSAVAQADIILHSARGNVSIVDEAGNRQSATRGVSLASGTTVTTGSNGHASLRLANGAELALESNSVLRVETFAMGATRGQSTTVLFLETGGVVGQVTGLTADSRFEVKTPAGVAVVKGTRFAVRFSMVGGVPRFEVEKADGEVEVFLLEGIQVGGNVAEDPFSGVSVPDNSSVIFEVIADESAEGGLELNQILTSTLTAQQIQSILDVLSPFIAAAPTATEGGIPVRQPDVPVQSPSQP